MPSTSFEVDYDRVLRSIHELNTLAGEGLGEVHKTADGARIKVRMTVECCSLAC